jgi:hypothetical protein
LKFPEGTSISGLLVLNYDIDTHPAKRPRVYAGDLEPRKRNIRAMPSRSTVRNPDN